MTRIGHYLKPRGHSVNIKSKEHKGGVAKLMLSLSAGKMSGRAHAEWTASNVIGRGIRC